MLTNPEPRALLPRPAATVVIATRNRERELYTAISSAIAQTADVEILVMDDGSTDGTADMVRSKFSGIRLVCSERSHGYVVQRNRAVSLAQGEIVVFIDDDACFSSSLVVEQTLRDFTDDRVGAVAIPYIEPRKKNDLLQRAPDDRGVWITDRFVGTAHAMRRAVFRRLGGYRGELVHQGEEGDLCVRMLDAGYVVRLGRADPIHHFESPRRDFRRMDFYGARNEILFVWQNAPAPFLRAHLLRKTVKELLFGLRVGRPLRIWSGVIAGWACMRSPEHPRAPVSAAAYRKFRELRTPRQASFGP